MARFPRPWSADLAERVLSNSHPPGACPDTFVFMNSGSGFDALNVYRSGHLSHLHHQPQIQLMPGSRLIEMRAPRSAAEELTSSGRVGDLVVFLDPPGLPGTVHALTARQAALAGDSTPVDAFATGELGLRTGPRWREAVSTALLGEWVAPLRRGELLHPSSLAQLRAQTQTLHRQLTPLWRRKARHERMLLLDTPLGNGVTLYDLVAASPAVEDLALGAAPQDPRLAMVLTALAPQERAVALAWAHWQPNSWADAAALAGAADPMAYGERVRRKLKRLGAEYIRRHADRRTLGGPLS